VMLCKLFFHGCREHGLAVGAAEAGEGAGDAWCQREMQLRKARNTRKWNGGKGEREVSPRRARRTRRGELSVGCGAWDVGCTLSDRRSVPMHPWRLHRLKSTVRLYMTIRYTVMDYHDKTKVSCEHVTDKGTAEVDEGSGNTA
jgi:hypothetical protein